MEEVLGFIWALIKGVVHFLLNILWEKRLKYITVLIVIHFGIIYGALEQSPILLICTFASVAVILVSVLARLDDGHILSEDSIFTIDVTHDGILGKPLMIVEYGLVVTNSIGWWMVRGGGL